MKVDSMFPRRYAVGADLKGQPTTLTIERVATEKMRPNPQSPEVERWVVYFKGAQKGVVLGRTLAYQISRALGEDDSDKWPGQQITLYPDPVVVAGVERVAIRARRAIYKQDNPGKLNNGHNGNQTSEVIK